MLTCLRPYFLEGTTRPAENAPERVGTPTGGTVGWVLSDVGAGQRPPIRANHDDHEPEAGGTRSPRDLPAPLGREDHAARLKARVPVAGEVRAEREGRPVEPSSLDPQLARHGSPPRELEL